MAQSPSLAADAQIPVFCVKFWIVNLIKIRSENHAKLINIFCGQNAGFQNAETDGTVIWTL
jgi:hypothetical protein